MAHFLLIYDRSAGRLLRQEQYGSSAEALEARFAAEREFAGQEQVEVVAFNADSEEALRRTHGRYFLTLGELADRMLR
jgi:hypothetical protein